MIGIGLYHVLGASCVLFSIGLATVLMRRHSLAIILGVLLMIQASLLNLASFDHFLAAAEPGGGRAFGFIAASLSTTQVVVAVIVAWRYFHEFGTSDPDAVVRLAE